MFPRMKPSERRNQSKGNLMDNLVPETKVQPVQDELFQDHRGIVELFEMTISEHKHLS